MPSKRGYHCLRSRYVLFCPLSYELASNLTELEEWLLTKEQPVLMMKHAVSKLNCEGSVEDIDAVWDLQRERKVE